MVSAQKYIPKNTSPFNEDQILANNPDSPKFDEDSLTGFFYDAIFLLPWFVKFEQNLGIILFFAYIISLRMLEKFFLVKSFLEVNDPS